MQIMQKVYTIYMVQDQVSLHATSIRVDTTRIDGRLEELKMVRAY